MHNIAVFGDNAHPTIVETATRVRALATQHYVRLHLPAGAFTGYVIAEGDAACVWYGCATPPGPQQKVPTPPQGAYITHHISAAVDPHNLAQLRVPRKEGLVIAWLAKQEHVLPVILTHCRGVLIVGASEELQTKLVAIIADLGGRSGNGSSVPPIALLGWSPAQLAAHSTAQVPLARQHVRCFGAEDFESTFDYLLG